MIKATKNWQNFETGLYFFKRKNGEVFIGKHIKGEKYPKPANWAIFTDEDVVECLMIVPTYEELKDERELL